MIETLNIPSEALPVGGRRIKKYLLVWCSAGTLDLEIDGRTFTVPAGHVITITSGQFHKFRDVGQARGIVLQFTYDFFCKDDTDIELIFHNGLFCHFDQNEVIDVSAQPLVGAYLQSIAAELQERAYQYLTSVHAKIKLILVEINRAKVRLGEEIWKPNALFLKFLELIRADFQHSRPVKYYAGRLGTTELQLNELSKLHAGKTAQQIIHGLIVSEAKRLLYYEAHSVKEVAYALGFKDPFYFSNFFKRHTHLSPQAFKEQIEA
ncbi:helix-turn-helix domain-containing protein [Flavilitoribacter nigricans]|nr:helix-turn-helix domain-containing protein [Flavilitoribacter nigricans]